MATLEILRPADVYELSQLISDATAAGRAIEARCGASKQAIGKPSREASLVDLSAYSGIVTYEPSELVLTVRPATPLTEVETLLAAHGQMLAFEPWDHAPLFGRAPGAATIGGIVAAGVAGSRRVSAGGVRDHLLGFAAVSGRGELFKAGGKVVKNVTGFDVSKVMAGSWGQLALFTELSLKIVPRPRIVATVALHGLSEAVAVSAMAAAMGSGCAVAAAAHLPAQQRTAAVTALRLEGFRESVEVRAQRLGRVLGGYGDASLLSETEADAVWAEVRHPQRLAAAGAIWRAQTAPSAAAGLVAQLERCGAECILDWAGGLIWIGAPCDLDVRPLLEPLGGHAWLVRAPTAVRAATPARQPDHPAIAALSARLKQAFDPSGVLDPERFN